MPQDKKAKMAMQMIGAKRHKMMKYLRRKDYEMYFRVTAQLGLRDTQPRVWPQRYRFNISQARTRGGLGPVDGVACTRGWAVCLLQGTAQLTPCRSAGHRWAYPMSLCWPSPSQPLATALLAIAEPTSCLCVMQVLDVQEGLEALHIIDKSKGQAGFWLPDKPDAGKAPVAGERR